MIEVVSPHDDAGQLHLKITQYLRAGVRLIWVVYPLSQTVEVHTAQGARTYGMSDNLEGGDVLPGFVLAVTERFA